MSDSEQTLSQADKSKAGTRLFLVAGRKARLLLGLVIANLRPTHALSADWRRRYDLARRGMSEGDPVFQASRQWALITVFYRLMLRAWGFDSFKRKFGRFLAAYEPDNPRYFEALHHVYRSALVPRDKWGLLDRLEEPELGDGDIVMHGGKRLSLDFLQSVDEFYRIQEALGFKQDDAVVFCEVGAGYGRLADVVLSAMPNAKFIIFDLPESLVLAQYYLTTRFPKRRAALYPESAGVLSSAAGLKDFDLIFGVPELLKTVPKKSVQVFINIFSFMEMSREQIEAYFGIVAEREMGAMFLKQHEREINLLDKSLNSRAAYPVRKDWTRLYEGTSALYADVFEDVWKLPR
jgi:putative sugar O-methyltransferase